MTAYGFQSWMTAHLFYNLFKDVYLPRVKGKSILILDGHGPYTIGSYGAPFRKEHYYPQFASPCIE
jgi:hypothetical protein